MITKLAGLILAGTVPVVGAGILPTAIGASRASDLSEEDRRFLRKKYGLDPDANLTLRNAGRAALGGVGGAVGGGIVGALGGAGAGLLGLKALKAGNVKGVTKLLGPGVELVPARYAAIGGAGVGAATGGIAGIPIGAYLASKKYSKERAYDLRNGKL